MCIAAPMAPHSTPASRSAEAQVFVHQPYALPPSAAASRRAVTPGMCDEEHADRAHGCSPLCNKQLVFHVAGCPTVLKGGRQAAGMLLSGGLVSWAAVGAQQGWSARMKRTGMPSEPVLELPPSLAECAANRCIRVSQRWVSCPGPSSVPGT